MSEHSLEEGAQVITQDVRMVMMLAGRVVETQAWRRAAGDRRNADVLRGHADDARRAERATLGVTDAQQRRSDAAAQVYSPLTDPQNFAKARPGTVATAYATARTWSDSDPRAAAAVEQIDALTADRWGVPAHRLAGVSTHGKRTPEQDVADLGRPVRELDRGLVERARDERWRERADTSQLARAWQAADAAGDQAVKDVLEDHMAARFGGDVEDFLRQQRKGEDQAAVRDVADARQSQRAYAQDLQVERAADPEREDFRTKPKTGVQDKDDLESRLDRETARAQTAESRANREAMDKAGVPASARQAREDSAPAFGRTSAEAAGASGRVGAQSTAVQKVARGRAHERGR